MRVGFADHYLDALEQAARNEAGRPNRAWPREGWAQEQRTAALAEWHLLLLGRLTDYEAEDRLDRLTEHPALGGPELTYLRARLAHQRGDVSRARELVRESLEKLPGHGHFLDFATEIGAPLPSRAQEIAKERQIADALLR
jgi:hypothetical protein